MIKYLKNCSIKKLLLLLFSVPVIILSADVIYSVAKLKISSNLTGQVLHQNIPYQTSMNDVKCMFKDIRLSNTKLSYAQTEDQRENYKKEIEKQTNDVVAKLDALKLVVTDKKDEMIIEGLKSDIQEYYRLSLKKDQYRHDEAQLKEFVRTQTTPKGKAIDRGMEDFNNRIENSNNQVNSEVAIATNPNKVIVCSIMAIIIAIWGLYMVNTFIGNEIQKLAIKTRKLADGEITAVDASALSTDSNNEIHILLISFNKIVVKLRDIISTLKNESDNLYSEAGAMTEAQQMISSSASNILTQALSMNTAIEEMASSAKEISENCSNAVSSSHDAHNRTLEGMNMVTETAEKIREYSKNTQEDAHAIYELGEKTKEINTIISTIQGIADQTNLLALNAAIEAARAGEHGKGFAVVADEVRTLASKTSESTKEITAMVQDLQMRAENANRSISNTVNQMENVANDTYNLKTNFEHVLTSVSNVADQITQIASSTEEQTGVSKEMAQNMSNVTDEIDSMVQQTERTAVNAEEIKENMNNLVSKQVAKFKM